MIAGLDVHGADAAARRAELARQSDEELGDRLARLARTLRVVDDVDGLAGAAGLPREEVIASPFALRAVVMGVAVGATTRHRELRASLDWTQTMAPPDVRDPDHGVWDRGVLRTGKYQGFLADEPFATYDPSHSSKWGPHELMHRAAGFFYRRELDRFELYLGARLNELIPVVLFYGPEQALRLDEGAFDRAAAGRMPSAIGRPTPWRTDDDRALTRRARAAAPILRAGLAHFERELAAIDEERASGRCVRTPTTIGAVTLDASSDATAYVVGHYARLTCPSVAAVLEAVPDDARAASVDIYRERIEATFDALLFAPLTVELAPAARARREAWDLLLRAAHLGEEMEADVEPFLASIARGEDVRAALHDALMEEEAAFVLADGAPEGRSLTPLEDGLAHVAPCTLGSMGNGAVEALAGDAALLDRAPLAIRLERFLARSSTPPIQAMARFERALLEARRDDAIERLCVPREEVPDELDDGWLIKSEAVESLSLDYDVVSAHEAFAAEGTIATPNRKKSALLVLGHYDEVAVVPLPPAIARTWAALGARTSVATLLEAIEGEWVRELIEAGALGWRPR